MARIVYREIQEGPGFWTAAAALGAVAAVGVGCAFYMEHHGHIVTGMNNQIVWGLPHVFAVFLIVAASGILNMASLASVFGKAPYKPLSRLSGLMAICAAGRRAGGAGARSRPPRPDHGGHDHL